MNSNRWTNSSVLKFAGHSDPVDAITKRARQVVIEAIDAGWSGPPFDPLELADYLHLEVAARDDVRDARTVPVGRSKLRIEFNPNRPRWRVRFSLAHELAHTLFPDCAAFIRNRGEHAEQSPDEWQLEALCNIAAAEFLIPVVSLPPLRKHYLGIDSMIALRRKFGVSAEALLIRVVRVTGEPCAMFCASPIGQATTGGSYRIDYTIGSRTWSGRLPRAGATVPLNSMITQCTGIGYTAKGNEEVDIWGMAAYLECEGIPPYPGSDRPRAAGILRPLAPHIAEDQPSITYLLGNALEPRGSSQKIIAHVVNDQARTWGGKGFAPQVSRKWPSAQREFRAWATRPSSLTLGNVHYTQVGVDTTVASMVCQRGYGPAQQPRIRYAALKQCLTGLTQTAIQRAASVHMPRIGSGQAGGRWEIVEEIVSSTLCAARVPTFVYDLPVSQQTGSEKLEGVQRPLEFSITER